MFVGTAVIWSGFQCLICHAAHEKHQRLFSPDVPKISVHAAFSSLAESETLTESGIHYTEHCSSNLRWRQGSATNNLHSFNIKPFVSITPATQSGGRALPANEETRALSEIFSCLLSWFFHPMGFSQWIWQLHSPRQHDYRSHGEWRGTGGAIYMSK